MIDASGIFLLHDKGQSQTSCKATRIVRIYTLRLNVLIIHLPIESTSPAPSVGRERERCASRPFAGAEVEPDAAER